MNVYMHPQKLISSSENISQLPFNIENIEILAEGKKSNKNVSNVLNKNKYKKVSDIVCANLEFSIFFRPCKNPLPCSTISH